MINTDIQINNILAKQIQQYTERIIYYDLAGLIPEMQGFSTYANN